jgi:uncharacterized protein
MVCPQCQGEFREGFAWCPDCDVALVGPPPEAAEEAEEDPETKEQALRARELGLVLLVGFGGSLVTSVHHWLVGQAHGSWSPGSDPTVVAVSRIFTNLPPLCVLVYVLGRRGRSLRDIGVTARWSDLWFGLGLFVFQLLPSLAAIMSPRGLGPYWRLSSLSTDALGALTLVSLVSVAAAEELIVRAYMMSEVLDLTGNAFLAVASSTCFQGLYHLYQGPRGAVFHAVTFLGFSLFYWKTRRATSCVVGHFLWDFWIALHRLF